MDSKYVCTFNFNLNAHEEISPKISNKNQLFHPYNDKTLSCVKAGDLVKMWIYFKLIRKTKLLVN